MKIQFKQNQKIVSCDLNQGIDLSISYKEGIQQVNCFYANLFSSQAVKQGDFIGSVKEGGPVNFYNTFINIHGGGTHTEGVGHISKERHSVNQILKQFFGIAYLISVYPTKAENGDRIIQSESLSLLLEGVSIPDFLIIRTLPNDVSKTKQHYSGTNPPYLSIEAMEFIVSKQVKHLLIDLPSVDREQDGGKLAAHHCFWEGSRANECSITELIYIPDILEDNYYLINLQLASMEQDAVPSRPLLFRLEETI